jgi:hypothetical protein
MNQLKLVCLILFYMFLWGICSAKVWASEDLYGPGPERRHFTQERISYYEGSLRRRYDINDVNDIKRATMDESQILRYNAMHLLTYRIGPEAIPELKKNLERPNPYERTIAARMLAIAGDKSGLERMRRDIAEFTKDDQEIDNLQTTKKVHRRSKDGRFFDAIRAAWVLAEFGDTSVFKLAAQAAIESERAMTRSVAIAVLAELGRIDKATLQAKGCDVESVLIAVAEQEKKQTVLKNLGACVQTTMRPEPVVRILEKLKDSPHLSEKEKRITERGIRRFKKRIEKEKKQRDEVENQEQNEVEENRK